MKKVLFMGGGSALLLLCLLFGAFSAGPTFASARSGPKQATPTTTPEQTGTPGATGTPKATTDVYCQRYQQDLAKRLGVSVSELQKASQAAADDTVDQLVKDGKLTQDQANKIKSRIADHTACKGHEHDHHGMGNGQQSP
jgi:hypothetical protein